MVRQDVEAGGNRIGEVSEQTLARLGFFGKQAKMQALAPFAAGGQWRVCQWRGNFGEEAR
jgi:hypothetical protein